MSLIALQEVSVGFGGPPLLDRVNLQIETDERVCLVGRNGEGKSTLLKVLAGDLPPDSGKIIRRPGLKSALLQQEVPRTLSGTVYDVVAGGMGELLDLLQRHHAISALLSSSKDPVLLAEFEAVQHDLETAGGWHLPQRVEAVLSRLQLNGEREFADLSGGLKRRVLLARALVCEPELLLLDEPTNHLDIDAIAWLEEFLQTIDRTLVFVTHDRLLAKKLAGRILDLDRGSLTSWFGNYTDYLKRKDEFLTVEADQQRKFDKKLSREEAWIRQGIKARRTRNQGRVRALESLRNERRLRRELMSKARMQLQEAELSGRLVVQAEKVSFRYGVTDLIHDFSTVILRGDKVGIIGPNGCGKTTLLKLLLGLLGPRHGTIRLGTNLRAAYFDQLRSQLDEEKSVAENVGDGQDSVIIDGRSRHIIGYLKDFLFTPDRARSPVSILSGGERNRLLLAKLFSRPANILVLDEPTNDLDVETLELLEELLLDFKGTVLLVSHDRAFLNNVATSTLVFEGNGLVSEYAGGYDDWLKQRRPETRVDPAKPAASRKGKRRPERDRPRKLSFKEKHELAQLPQRIEDMEAKQQQLYATLSAPAFYQESGAKVAEIKARLSTLETELDGAFQRWEELEALNDE